MSDISADIFFSSKISFVTYVSDVTFVAILLSPKEQFLILIYMRCSLRMNGSIKGKKEHKTVNTTNIGHGGVGLFFCVV